MPDYDLKLEIVNLLKCLFLPDYAPYPHHATVKPAKFSDETKMSIFLDATKIQKFLKFFEIAEEKGQKNLVGFDEKIL